ncbi:MAG: hypothetical protein WC996_06320, partial [Peptostreptococcales bacterium]
NIYIKMHPLEHLKKYNPILNAFKNIEISDNNISKLPIETLVRFFDIQAVISPWSSALKNIQNINSCIYLAYLYPLFEKSLILKMDFMNIRVENISIINNYDEIKTLVLNKKEFSLDPKNVVFKPNKLLGELEYVIKTRLIDHTDDN